MIKLAVKQKHKDALVFAASNKPSTVQSLPKAAKPVNLTQIQTHAGSFRKSQT